MIRLNFHKKLDGPEGELILKVNCDIQQGEFVTLYGESGVGKTSILRIIAGLMEPDEGTIEFDSEVWNDTTQKKVLPSQNRKVGYVFQDYALFPNMTIRKNLLYALEKGQDQRWVDELIEIMELEQLQHRKPATLSGGQKQRVALARALVRKPRLLMLDEPLSALDKSMRTKLQDYLQKVHQLLQLTTILVSHDVSEIFKLSDRVICLENGVIKKDGTPEEIFSRKMVSGNYQFSGEVISINKEDVVYIIAVMIGNNVVKVVADEKEANQLKVGDNVLVASKAFNPIITKLM